jgi:RNA polymerase sigma-70 factor (ECF subfamily)
MVREKSLHSLRVDRSLVRAIRDGADDAMDDQLADLRRGLVRVAAGMLGEATVAEDMAQAALLKFVSYVREVDSEIRNPAGLAVTIVRNLCISTLRQRSRRRGFIPPGGFTLEDGTPLELAAEVVPQDEAMIQDEREQRLREAIQRLKPRHRAVLQGLFWEGKTQEEVARGLGATVRTVYNLREKAFALLMDWLR